MLIILSPSKSQAFTSPRILKTYPPLFANEIQTLAQSLKKLSETDIATLMNISPKLAKLNFERFQHFNPQHYTEANSRPALFAYQGAVYQGLEAETLSDDDLAFAQQHLLILSGLFGALRPFDLIQAYRLEMATKLKIEKYKDLYAFWQDPLCQYINERIKTEMPIINLASDEYSKVLNPKKIPGSWFKIDFKDQKQGKYQVIGLHAKKARGLMARFIIKHRITVVDELKRFDSKGYRFEESLSSPLHLVFHRG